MSSLTSTAEGVQVAVRMYKAFVDSRERVYEYSTAETVEEGLQKVYTTFSELCTQSGVTTLQLAIAVDQHQALIHQGEYTWLDVLAARNLDRLTEATRFGKSFQEHPLELAAYDIVRAYYATKAH